MPHLTDDRVLETSTSTGTGVFTVAGAVTGFRTFASIPGIAINDTLYGYIEGVDANGLATGEWEDGLYTYSAANQLTRTTIIRSSNAGAAVNFSAGTKRVGLTLLASKTAQFDNVGAVQMPAASAEPGTPAAGLTLYAREIIPGQTVAKTKRPSGVDSPLQDDLSFNGLAKWTGSNNTISAMGAAAMTTVGTLASVTPASGSAKSQLRRVQVPSAAAAGSLCSVYLNNAGSCPVFRGAIAGEGGYRYVARFALQTLQAGNRFFAGLADVVSAPTNVDPTTNTTPGKIGLAINANTGNWNFVHNLTGTAPTIVALGANFPVDTTSLMELALFVRPYTTSAGSIGYRIRRYTTASDAPAFETTGTISTNQPAATTLLHPTMWMTNNATALAVVFHLGSIAIQADW